MRFRLSVLKSLPIWLKYHASRRREKRLLRQISRLRTQNELKLAQIKDFYEHELARERTKYDIMLDRLTSRVMEAVKLNTLTGSLVGLDEQARKRVMGSKPVESNSDDLLNTLTQEEKSYLTTNYHESFLAMARDAGRSDAEAESDWREFGLSRGVEEVKGVFLPTN